MQSTKDTKYIFKKSDLNLLYSKFFICLFVFLCVWNYLATFIKSQLISFQIKYQQVISNSIGQ